MNIEQAKHSARAFHLASRRCLEERPLQGGRVEFLAVPAIACAAFSIELGLKALLLRKGQRVTGHDLVDLFNALDKATQERIVAASAVPEPEFMPSLQAARDVFEEWRYIHEKETRTASPVFLSAMAEATLVELSRT